MALVRKINRRKGLRIQFDSVITQVRDALLDESVTKIKLIGLKNNLVGLIESLNGIDEEIQNGIEPENVQEDVLECLKVLDPTHELLAEISIKLESFDPAVIQKESTGSIKSVSARCKLPKFELPSFKGNALQWQGFWDQFNSSIHQNEELNDIDRFNYLKRYLEGQALETISGLVLSSANYKEAINILKQRYGNPQVLISAHMDSLIKMAKVKNRNDTVSLRKLYNNIESCVRNLSILGLDVQAYGSLFIPLLKDKLPEELNIVISRGFGSDVWKLDRLLQFFNDELVAYENCVSVSKPNSSEEKKKYEFTASNLHNQSEHQKSSCVFCDKEDHVATRCKSITNINTRKSIVKRKGRCFVCLGTGHLAKDCPTKYVCRKCQGRHNISICPSLNNESRKDITHNGHVSSCNGILLQTAKAEISDTKDLSAKNVRVLFDSGSQRSYVSESVCKSLKLKFIRKERVLIKVFGQTNAKVQTLKVVQMKVKHKLKKGYFTVVEALCVPTVCSPLTGQFIDHVKRKYDCLSELDFADNNVDSLELNVGILIGLDFYHCFFTGKVRKTLKGPVASETTLGWVLSGSFGEGLSDSQHCFQTHVLKSVVEKEEDCLKSALNKFWEVESVGMDTESSVINDFEKEIFHDGDRYVTKLPFKPDHDQLPDNYSVSLKRLQSTVKRLKDRGIFEQYDQIFEQYEHEGIIERVHEESVCKDSGSVHYLPHRAVVREDKQTTKIRAVFDASCGVNGPSLNDCLYSGPNLLSKIFDVLFRFRLNKIAVVADIKQAFLNIGMDLSHRDFLRFLWFDSRNEILIYRFCRVVFGVTSSPFLLNGTIRQHLNKYLDKYPSIAMKLKEDLYVDDTTSGCNSVSEGKHLYESANQIMADAGFTLRKWATNDTELQNFFDLGKDADKCMEDDTTFAKSQIVGMGICKQKVLGLDWDKVMDDFVFDFEEVTAKCKSIEVTKRNVLSMSASIYDPLGMISPITAEIKTIFQSLCVNKCDWDDIISGEIKVRWMELVSKLELLGSVRVPRFGLIDWNEILSLELHGFCDSSTQVYCAVVYARIVTANGVKVKFWSSKTKVAPLKRLSIPRLELLGCVLLVNLIADIRRAIMNRVKVERVLCWTDSTVALYWIRGKEKTWRPWVENRVVNIRKVVPREMWFHVAGVENPADAPTRAVDDFRSLFKGQWFHGPSFLSFDNISYNHDNDCDSLVSAQQELRQTNRVLTTVTALTVNDCDVSKIVKFDNYSSLKKLINVVAFVIRFKRILLAIIQKTDVGCRDETLSIEELNISLESIIKSEQRALVNEPSFRKLKSNLNLFLDEKEIYRLRGRFGETNFPEDQKFPILIQDQRSHLTQLIVRDAHESMLHFGVETTLAKVREKYWIVRGRNTVRNILKKCVICKRFQGRTLLPPTSPDLPEYRVNHLTYAFEATGLDFAGPLFVSNNCKDSSKVYILLFTCASSRAIHLELTPNMKSPAFIRAFKRFISRRGKPNVIINDNFKTFRSTVVKSYMANLKVKQKFILPASPWWGGFYERLVRSVKTALKKILKKSMLKFEELETVLCEVESVINQRPLCYSSDEDLEESLTPNHLIFGRQFNNSTSSHGDEVMTVEHCTRRVKHVTTVLQHFWKRFSVTYLSELRQHHLYRNPKVSNSTLKLNDVVLIRDDLPLPRSRWKTGKIEELIIGRDGKLRGVKLKVTTDSGKCGFIHRPLQKIIPFEISDNSDDAVGDSSTVPETDISELGVERGENWNKGRVARKAAIEGQQLRQLRSKYL